MSVIKKILTCIGSVIKIILGTICGYIGVVINLFGTVLGLMASFLVVAVLIVVCVYVKVEPMFEEAREVVFDRLVSLSEDDFILNEDTVVYTQKGKEIGRINAGHYEYVDIKNISPYIYEGYIAVEDKRFKTHAGVDMTATLRAGVALVKNRGEITQGGSTITQQLIKNNLLSQEKSYTRKIAEIFLAPTVESKFTKDEIMEFYCNSNYYGNRCYGVQSASQYYFGVDAKDLKPYQAALLIGLSNSPTAYDPVANPDAAKEKRDQVLKTMYDQGVITERQYNKGISKKLKVEQQVAESSDENYMTSYAVHCAALELMKQEDFDFQYTFADSKAYNDYMTRYGEVYGEKMEQIRSGGYRIYTSLVPSIQKKLQASVDETLRYNIEMNEEGTKYAMQGAAVCVDNDSQYVVAIVGGRGTDDLYNRGFLSSRQPGSSIKPLIDYTPAFESGSYSPSTIVKDQEIENGPKNAGGGYKGNITVREAVARSLNTVAWQVLEDITPEYGLNFLGNMRFHSISYVDNDNLALSLGGFTEGVRVCDMAKGYATLANNGQYSDRTCIVKIEKNGEDVVYEDDEKRTQVYSEDAAWMMTDVLKGVLEESYGTGRSLKLDGQIAAGKTGTTNNSKDIWFCGYTKYYSTAVWVGYDTPKEMSGQSGAGLSGAIWKTFMNQIHEGKKQKDFSRPSGVYLAKYSASTGEEIPGTALKGKKAKKRLDGYDYFSSSIKENAEEFLAEKEEKNYEDKVRKALESFEKFYITSVEEYYEVDDKYNSLRKKIAKLNDDELRTDYATRAATKYEELKEQMKDWESVVKDYATQQSEEKDRLAAEKQREAEEARQKQTEETNIANFNTKLKKLQGHKYQPKNMDALIEAAQEALEKCKEYSSYTTLAANLKNAITDIRALPTKSEYDQTKKKEQEEKDRVKQDLDDLINEGGSDDGDEMW